MRDVATFVLLDDARPGGATLLYRDPREIVVAHEVGDVAAALGRVRACVAAGRHAAGYLEYGAAPAFEPRACVRSAGQRATLLWFGIFDAPRSIDPATIGDGAGARCGKPVPSIDAGQHAGQVAQVQALIAAGDLYQANLSFRASVPFVGDPLALYARLRAASGAGWGAVVRHRDRWLLSLSPELFFRIADGRIEARPMKGTRPRGSTPAEDDALAIALAANEKDRAENLMIVDLLRNDLARVAAPGSVTVPALFEVERYPTLHQMVSRVEAELAPGSDAVDALAALFPCGSITGAPKLRAMEVIAEVERDARGVYTGTIGAFVPDGSAGFSVAIRTLVIEEGENAATIGLGSAIVADSREADEWAECLAKGAFVTAGQRAFDLIETMRFDPLDGIVDLDAHVARLKASATALAFTMDRHAVRNELHAATFRLATPSRVRIRLARSGAVAIEATPVPTTPTDPVTIAIVPLPVAPSDFRLRHKTSDRDFYDAARKAAGTFEIVFLAPDGSLTEGSFTNLFVRRPDGVLVTPPLVAGLMPGVLRARLLAAGEAVEGRVTPADLADGFLLGNAVRGLIAARLA